MKLTRNKILFIVVPLLLVIAVVAMFVILDTSRQKHLRFEYNGVASDGPVGAFPLYSDMSEVETAPGFKFKISSTTSLSTISRPTLERLKAMGGRVDSASTLLIGRTIKYGVKYYTKTFSVDLPLATYYFETDSATGQRLPHLDNTAPKRYLRNVEFVEAHPGDPNSIGVDLLSLFAVEYSVVDTSLTFHHSIPDNYDVTGRIFIGHGVKDLIGTGSRFYLDMRVDHDPYTFLINTALRDVPVKMPIESMLYQTRNTGSERIRTLNDQEFDAVVDRNAWCEYGKRAGGRKIYYYTDNSDVFEINPIAFFGQNMIIDFRHGTIGFNETFDMKFSENQ